MENQTLPTDNSNVNNKNSKNWLIIVLVSLLPIALISLLLYVFFFMDSDVEKLPQEGTVSEEKGLVGEVYMTLSPLGAEKANIYKLDLPTMELEEYFKDSPYRNYMASFSPDLEDMVFVRGYENNEYQVMLYDEGTKGTVELTEKSEIFPRNPKFSSDGNKLAYWVFEEEGYDFGGKSEDHFGSTPEDHNIYIVDKTGVKEKVAEGAYPLFLPGDEEILFLKSEGLYTLNLNNGQEESIFPLVEQGYYEAVEDYLQEEGIEADLPVWLVFRFNICPEGKFLVITNTLISEVSFLEVSSWSPFVWHNFLNTSFAGPNWPVFSPDGEQLLLQGFVSEGAYYSWVDFLSFEDFESLEILDLDVLEDWEPQAIWVTDWIVR